MLRAGIDNENSGGTSIPNLTSLTCPSTHWGVVLLFRQVFRGVILFLTISSPHIHELLFCHLQIFQSPLKQMSRPLEKPFSLPKLISAPVTPISWKLLLAWKFSRRKNVIFTLTLSPFYPQWSNLMDPYLRFAHGNQHLSWVLWLRAWALESMLSSWFKHLPSMELRKLLSWPQLSHL